VADTSQGRRWWRAATGAVLVAAVALGGAGAAEARGRFVDDDGLVHEPMIESVAAAGLTAGCTADGARYCPAAPVDRAQMATFLVRAFALGPATRDWFEDDNGNAHEDSINRVAEAGVASGVGPGRFGPSQFVTRAQMASFLARPLNLPPTSSDRFRDDSGSPHEGNINRVAEAGITTGCSPDGTLYCPASSVRRDQMASFLGRAKGIPPRAPGTPTTYSGTGDQVIAVDKPNRGEPAIAVVTMGGDRNNIVWALDQNLEQTDLLVNTIGTYNGEVLVDLGSSRGETRSLQIRSAGSWTIELRPLSSARSFDTQAAGTGDAVLRYARSGPAVATFTHDGERNFIVWAYRDDGRSDLLVNEIGPYSGSSAIRGPAWVEVRADGAWTIEVR
jgi:hypothetical protein